MAATLAVAFLKLLSAAEGGIGFKDFMILMLLQPEKAFSPMLLTYLGISTPVKKEQSLKASAGIVVTLYVKFSSTYHKVSGITSSTSVVGFCPILTLTPEKSSVVS